MTSNTPQIYTNRLILRRFTSDDVEAFFAIMSDKKVNTFLPLFPLETMEKAKEYLHQHYIDSYEKPAGFRYAICLQSDNIPIGYANVSDKDSYDFGYALNQEHWGKGIITEACKAVIEQLRAAKIPYITATHDIHNPKSGNVMKRIGMTYCYSYKEQCQPKDILVTFRMYQLNLDGQKNRVYQKYRDIYPVHFVEETV